MATITPHCYPFQADLSECVIESTTIDRTHTKKDLSAWVGKTTSNIGIQYLRLNDGIIIARKGFERTDIGILSFSRKTYTGPGLLFNVFIEPDGTHSGPNGGIGDVKLTPEEEAYIDAQVKKWCEMNAEHVARQVRWFAEAPYMTLEGLTPERAVAKLDELGW